MHTDTIVWLRYILHPGISAPGATPVGLLFFGSSMASTLFSHENLNDEPHRLGQRQQKGVGER